MADIRVRVLFHKALRNEEKQAALNGARVTLGRFSVLCESGELCDRSLKGVRDRKTLQELLAIPEKTSVFLTPQNKGWGILQQFIYRTLARNVLGVAVAPYKLEGYAEGRPMRAGYSGGKILDVIENGIYARSAVVSTYQFRRQLEGEDGLKGVALATALALGELFIDPRTGNGSGGGGFYACKSDGCLMATDSVPYRWTKRFVDESRGFCSACVGAIEKTVRALKEGRL